MGGPRPTDEIHPHSSKGDSKSRPRANVAVSSTFSAIPSRVCQNGTDKIEEKTLSPDIRVGCGGALERAGRPRDTFRAVRIGRATKAARHRSVPEWTPLSLTTDRGSVFVETQWKRIATVHREGER
jgi:hypothetical protein